MSVHHHIWQTVNHVEPLRRFHEIYCVTCIKSVPSKKALVKHMGHDVHYRNERDEIDD